MSRPGKFAKSSRVKQLRQFRRRKQQQASQAIAWDQVEDFLLGRYHLVQGSRLPQTVDATIQRFFSEWLRTAMQAGEDQVQWDVATISAATLKRIGNRVPWQFYAVLWQQTARWQKFLLREGPVVPLAERRQLIHSLEQSEWARLIANQLAVNLLTATAVPITDQQREQLVKSLLQDDQLQWNAVAALFGPLGFQVDEQADAATKQWLNALLALTIVPNHD